MLLEALKVDVGQEEMEAEGDADAEEETVAESEGHGAQMPMKPSLTPLGVAAWAAKKGEELPGKCLTTLG